MEDLIRKYNRKLKRRKAIRVLLLAVDAVLILASLVFFVVLGAKGNDFMSFWGILYFALPLITITVFLVIAFRKDKLKEQLYADLEEGHFSAEEILLIGEKIRVNLFDAALRKRCDELGLSAVPEWCVRDGVLPDEA